MNEVFAKTRELGEALMKSEEYAAMKQAEDIAMANSEAAELMARYLEHKSQLEELMHGDVPNPEAMAQHGQAMEELQRQLQENEDIVRLTQTREAFNSLISQVNQVLRFIITGQMDEDSPEEGGCSGSCATCRGCH